MSAAEERSEEEDGHNIAGVVIDVTVGGRTKD
jgi:hypothetical protein